MTPNTVDVKDIKILNSEGKEMDDSQPADAVTRRSRNKIAIQKMNLATGGLYTDHDYYFTSKSAAGWTDGGVALTAAQLTLAPGESIAVSSSQGDTVYFQFPSPVSE